MIADMKAKMINYRASASAACLLHFFITRIIEAHLSLATECRPDFLLFFRSSECLTPAIITNASAEHGMVHRERGRAERGRLPGFPAKTARTARSGGR